MGALITHQTPVVQNTAFNQADNDRQLLSSAWPPPPRRPPRSHFPISPPNFGLSAFQLNVPTKWPGLRCLWLPTAAAGLFEVQPPSFPLPYAPTDLLNLGMPLTMAVASMQPDKGPMTSGPNATLPGPRPPPSPPPLTPSHLHRHDLHR